MSEKGRGNEGEREGNREKGRKVGKFPSLKGDQVKSVNTAEGWPREVPREVTCGYYLSLELPFERCAV